MPRRLLRWLLVAGMASWLISSHAQVALPPLNARVTDLTRTLSPAQVSGLEDLLRAFEARKGSQIAVLMLHSTQPEPIEQFSIRLAEAWKLGRARVDDGVILVVAKDDRRLRIEVGYGLEGVIPDAQAKRIIDEIITPRLREGDFNGGIRGGVEAMQKLIDGEALPDSVKQAAAARGGDLESMLVIGITVTMMLGAMLGGLLRSLLGKLAGSVVTGVFVGIAAWMIVGGLMVGIVAGVLAFLFALIFGGARGVPINIGGGGFGGGNSSDGGFSGSGGGFGGGGASGRW